MGSVFLAVSKLLQDHWRDQYLCGVRNLRWYSMCLPTEGCQAELTWVAGYIPRWFTHHQTGTRPSTNWAWREVTTLNKINVLPISQTAWVVMSIQPITTIRPVVTVIMRLPHIHMPVVSSFQ